MGAERLAGPKANAASYWRFRRSWRHRWGEHNLSIGIHYLILGEQISPVGSTMGSPRDFRDVMNLVWAGKIKTAVGRVLSLGKGRQGHALLESGEKSGKVVLAP